MIVYLALSVYIISLLLALVLVITGKKRSKSWFKAGLVFHLLFFVLFVFFCFGKNDIPDGSYFNYAFIAFLCSGLITGGLVLRSGAIRILKIYFSLFFLSLFFFFYSPSRFASFLLKGELNDHSPKKFFLFKNYFLEQQAATPDFLQPYSYKLVQHFGLFHKTILRDIIFPGEPGSVKVLDDRNRDSVLLRVFYHQDAHQKLKMDSTDLNLALVPEDGKKIELRK